MLKRPLGLSKSSGIRTVRSFHEQQNQNKSRHSDLRILEISQAW